MKKTLTTLFTLLTLTFSFQSHALVGGITALFNPAAGGYTALAGLGLMGAGVASINNNSDEMPGILTFLFGTVLLSGDNDQNIEFQELSADKLTKMGLNADEQVAYNDNVEELSLSFEMVANDSADKQDAQTLWQDQEYVLGSDAINGMKKVLENSLN